LARRAHFAVVNTVGHAGSVAADDTEIVESMVAANAGETTKDQDFIYELGSHFEQEMNPVPRQPDRAGGRRARRRPAVLTGR
jgi:hypothetical protein